MKPPFLLISKSIFFPEKGILAFGDVHLGYEKMLLWQGLQIPFKQLEQTIKDLEEIKKQIELKGYNIKTIIILGDLKHHFNFQIQEKFEVRDFLDFIEENITEDIILIKGNHEKFELDKKEYKDFHVDEDLGVAFIHGHKDFPEIYDKKIKTIVLTHMHTAVTLKDKTSPKREKFKAFLVGNYRKKQVIILPSFFTIIEGTDVAEPDEFAEGDENFAIIPKTKLKNFEVFVVGKDKVYEFGKLKELR